MAQSKDDDTMKFLSRHKEEAHLAKDLLSCTICFDKFTQPRMLPCLHSFCEECLGQHITSTASRLSSRSQYFKCPQCRELTHLPDAGVTGFRRDFRICQVQDVLCGILKKRCIPGDNCDVCNETQKEWIIYCSDCSKHLCQDCSETHRKIEIFSTHKVSKKVKSYEVCKNHADEAARYLCVTCSMEVCTMCLLQCSTHRDHHIRELETGLQEYKLNLLKAQAKLQTKLSEAQDTKSHIDALRDRLAESKLHAEQDIRKRLDHIRQMLKKSECDVLNSTTDSYNKAMMRHKNVEADLEQLYEEMQHLEELVMDTLDAPTSPKLLELYKDMPLRINKLLLELDILHREASSMDSLIKFEPSGSKIRVGKIKIVQLPSGRAPEELCEHIKEDSSQLQLAQHAGETHKESRSHVQLMYKFGKAGVKGGEFNSPRDVCFLSDETIVVADCSNERLQRFRRNGLLINTIGDGKIKPWGVTGLQDGNIAITDNHSKRVRLFTPQGEAIASVGHFLCPCGIVQNKDGHLIVTDFFSTYVYILSTEGTPINEFAFRSVEERHACGVSRLAVLQNNNNIVVSDVSNRMIKMFSSDGAVLWKTLADDTLSCPQGIAVTNENALCVADAVLQNILWIDPSNGKLAGELLETEVEDPTGLAISPSGHLILTQIKFNAVLVFKIENNP